MIPHQLTEYQKCQRAAMESEFIQVAQSDYKANYDILQL
jgi:hypothetical protein